MPPAFITVQDMKGLERDIKRAIDRRSFNAGHQAARDLAGMSGPKAMAMRLELFDAKLTTYMGVFLRDWFYSGMRDAGTEAESRLLLAAAAGRRNSTTLRLLSMRALAACRAPVASKLLLASHWRRGPPELRREWQRTLGAVCAQGRL